VACEPTGQRWRVLGQLTAERVMAFVCVQPLISSWAGWAKDLTHDKTDGTDAVLIARVTAQPRCYAPEPVEGTWRRLRHLGVRRERLLTEHTGRGWPIPPESVTEERPDARRDLLDGRVAGRLRRRAGRLLRLDATRRGGVQPGHRRGTQVGVHLLGRRLYETMLYWETADQNPSLDYSTVEFAAIWKALPKVVFSTTLSAVQGNARLASGDLAEEIERLRRDPAEGDIAIGGATLAAEAAALGLIDEYRARVYPVLVGGGIPFFPRRERRVDLELVETRTFSSRVVYLRYRVAR
jgi:dihydrofolate reductase